MRGYLIVILFTCLIVTTSAQNSLSDHSPLQGDHISKQQSLSFNRSNLKGWVRQIAKGGSDMFSSIAIDKDGGVYVAGFEGYGSRGFINKYHSDGNLEWTTNAGSSVGNIVVDASGVVYVTLVISDITTIGDTVLTPTRIGDRTAFIVKLRSDGSIVLAKRLVDNRIGDIAVDALGFIYISQGLAPDIRIAKYDANGNDQWKRTITGNGSPNSMTVDPLGNVYLTGEFDGSLNFGTTTIAEEGSWGDMFVAKFDTGGNTQWARNAGGHNNDKGEGIVVSPDGYIYVTGWFLGTVDFGGAIDSSLGSIGSDIFVVRYRPDGIAEWVRSMGALGVSDIGSAITVDAWGNLYVTGYFGGDRYYKDHFAHFGDISLLSRNYSADIFVAKLRSDGAFDWVRDAGGSVNDRGLAIAVDNEGNVYAGGVFEQTGYFEGDSLISAGRQDGFIWKLSSIPSSVPENQEDINAITIASEIYAISPNPIVNEGVVEVKIIEAGHTRIRMIDMLGREVESVYDGELPTGRHILPLHTGRLQTGSYYVLLTTPTVRSVRRVDIVK